jgi:serine/threonine protein phosphatase PrpC
MLSAHGAFFAASHKSHSEDRILLGELVLSQPGSLVSLSGETLRVAVADGVGGSQNGAAAAEAALAELADASMSADDEGLHRIHASIGATLPGLRGGTPPATTLIIAELKPGALSIASVGDSEAWLLREGRLIRLSDQHGEDGVISSCLGGGLAAFEIARDCPVDALQPSDLLLLCSDGLFKCLERSELRALAQAAPSPGALAAALLQAVASRHRPDDVAFLLVSFASSIRSPESSP